MLPLHNHSHYSALDGYSTPREIAERIEKLKLPGCFLTDHGTTAGWHEFGKAMAKKDLFAGYGMEAYQSGGHRSETGMPRKEASYHLILLAKSETGYRNIMRLSDEANRSGFYYVPRLDWELLAEYHEGIICTSACINSLINQRIMADDRTALDQMRDIFRDDFYIEIHTYDHQDQTDLNHELSSLARERGIGMVYANDAHYADPDQWDYHEAFMCAQMGTNIYADKKKKQEEQAYNPKDPTRFHPQCLYIMGEDDVRKRLTAQRLSESIVDEAIKNSDYIMSQCLFKPEKPKTRLPKFDTKKYGTDSTDLLIGLVERGIARKYGGGDPEAVAEEVWERTGKELKAILEAGLGDYFLIVWDYIDFALKKGQMVGPGRGSSGGSILAYALDITSIDPLRYTLQFERFWNPGRTDGLPDIDTDFESEGRLDVVEFLKKKYGPNRVVQIGNHALLWPKAAIDKAGKVLYEDGEVPYGRLVNIKKILERAEDAGKLPTWKEIFADDQLADELEPYYNQDEKLFRYAVQMAERISSYSIHASAVVIGDIDLPGYLPARLASDAEASTKVLVTQDEMHAVEEKGFPKFDLLRLLNLDILMKAILSSDFLGELEGVERRKAIVRYLREEVDYDKLRASAWELIDRGLTLGVFQVEDGHAAKTLAKRLAPRNLDHLAALVALNKPGPLRSGDTERYLKRRAGEEDVVYPHPILEEILADTYGIFLYQEQVISYFQAIGYDLGEADHIRKIIGKKLVSEMEREFPRYMERAQHYMDKATAKSIWERIENYSKYGFNKAHAVAYAIIMALTLHVKDMWPAEFVMASIEKKPKKVGGYVDEARRMGINVRPPDVNESQAVISSTGTNEVIYGLVDIKGVGGSMAQKIVEGRPILSPEDFVERALGNATAIKLLSQAGAFDSFDYRLEKCIACDGEGKVPAMVPKKSGKGLKKVKVPCEECCMGWARAEIPHKRERAKLEEELLGITLVDLHSELVSKYADEIAELNTIEEANTEAEGEWTVAGIVSQVKPTKVKNTARYNPGADMGHFTIQWDGREMRVAAFPKAWTDFSWMIKPNTLAKFTVTSGPRGASLKKAWVLTD